MALRKEIEKSLRTEDTAVDAVEDHAMRDSVLEMASADFKEQDVLNLPLVSRKRVGVDAEADYPGKPVSRKKYGQDVGVALVESDTEDEGEEDEIDSDDALEDGLMGLDDESAVEEEDEESEVDDEEGDLSMGEDDAGSEPESGQLENEAEDNDGSSPLKVFSSSSMESSDIQKGLAIREQLQIWESILENRIKIEPGLVAANQLYQRDKMAAFIFKEKSSGSYDILAVHKALQDLSSAWSKLQEALGEQSVKKFNGRKSPMDGGNDDNPDDESITSSEASENHPENETSDADVADMNSGGEDIQEPPCKKPRSNEPPSLDQSYADFAPFRDAEITKWNEKAKVSSGKAAQKDFSAFDQSILTLIESILFDKYRLVRKTQLKRSDYVIYGKSEEEKQEEKSEEESEGLIVNKTQVKKDQVYDPEIFDDGDFYQKLLRDFIDGKSSDGGISKHERKLMELHRHRIKMKRKIDTRATKGRKLRYVVHPKLVNYMAPVPCSSFSAEAESQLLKSLFGRTVTNSA